MSSADKSASSMIQRKKAQTLAVFRALNPDVKSQQNFESTRIVQETQGCLPCLNCQEPGEFTGITYANDQGWIPGGHDLSGTTYNWRYDILWDPVPNATSYTVTLSDPETSVYIWLTETSIRIYTNTNPTAEITALNACGSTTQNVSAPCFLAGSLVSLANGSTKAIEDIRVGDIVVGAFGEENVVLALHRPLLGSKQMCKINGEHSTTAHHPHISVDKKFYCADPYTLDEETYGRTHKVYNAFGELVDRFLHGLNKGRTQLLREGIELKTIEGSRVVAEIDMYSLPADTQLYNLVVGGSHTYHVDGYAVTGWPREDDFDYDAWIPRSSA